MRNIKKTGAIFFILFMIGLIVFCERKSYWERTTFRKEAINSYIIQKRSNWTGGRSYDYLLPNNIVLTLPNNQNLVKGDSISKKSNTYRFSVYRKDTVGQYRFYKDYDIQ